MAFTETFTETFTSDFNNFELHESQLTFNRVKNKRIIKSTNNQNRGNF